MDYKPQVKVGIEPVWLITKKHNSLCRFQENYETGRKALLHKGFLLFLTPSALSAAVSENHAVANDRDTSDSGRCWSDFWRPLDGENAPQADVGQSRGAAAKKQNAPPRMIGRGGLFIAE